MNSGFGKGVIVSEVAESFNPFRKRVLIITAIFFLILLSVGVIESFEQKSIRPALDRSFFKIVASDHQLGRYVEVLASGSVPHFTGFFDKSFPSYLWFWIKFIFNIIANLYFVFFFIWGLYEIFNLIDNSHTINNIIYAFISYAILSLLIGTALYLDEMSGKSMPDDALSDWASRSYPFEGTVKFFKFFINRDSLVRIADWSETPIGGYVTGTPDAVNVSEIPVS